MSKSLLPSPASALERAIDTALSQERAPSLTPLWNPWTCPASHLPWLAYACGVDEWSLDWPEETQRTAIASAMEIASHRGTVWAVREALRAAGYADAELQEALPILRYDGAQLHDTVETYAGGARWALFKVIADIGEDKGVGGAELQRLLRLIDRAKNVRSVLREVEYRASVDDVLAVQDDQAVDVVHTVEEVRPWGRRYDGAIAHDQATQLPRAAQSFDGTYRYTGELAFDGLKPFHDWEITGERYENRWDEMAFGLRSALDDTHQTTAFFDGSATYEDVLTHGHSQPPAVDAGILNVVLRRRHNGRLTYANTIRYAGNAPLSHAL